VWEELRTASQNFLARLSLFLTAEPAHSVPVPDWCPPTDAVGVGFKEIPLKQSAVVCGALSDIHLEFLN